MSLRMSSEMWDELQIIGAVTGMTASAIVKQALARHIRRLKEDSDFQEKLDWQLNRMGELKD